MAAYIGFQPTDFFNTLLWTGNSTTDRAMTGVGFQPDFVWIKSRNEGTDHEWQDSVRGSTKYLNSNDEGAEATETEGVKSFDSDGYTLGNANYWNWSAKTFVGWSWKGGTTSGIATNGSTTITPTAYSFNQTAGISIVKYTGNETAGAGLAHGLGAVPGLMIFKRLDGTTPWQVYHQSLGPTKNMVLNTTGAVETYTTRYNDTAPDSVNAILGTSTWINKSGSPHVGYIFAEKKGYSKFGGYTGNANANGPFIYTGFKPAFVLIKITAISAWILQDNKRPGYNQTSIYSVANTTAAEPSNLGVDFLANGFKIRDSDSEVNHSGGSYIYAAFAEAPLVSSNDVPGVAR